MVCVSVNPNPVRMGFMVSDFPFWVVSWSRKSSDPWHTYAPFLYGRMD